MNQKSILITGGSGFIGSNSAAYFMAQGWNVHILDNFSRKGTRLNYEWLKTKGDFTLHEIDLVDEIKVREVFSGQRFDFVLHLAAQVAVTTSVSDPRYDFKNNAWASFNLLEAVRNYSPKAFCLFASTNKVYGKLDYVDTQLSQDKSEWQYTDLPRGVDESFALDFHSPYGCSKGAADQYFIDYARIYGLKTCVFRQSCIYGTRQFGIEDQGWVAWFSIATSLNRNITIYGDGKQVRDVLYVDDLVRAYHAAFESQDKVVGQAYNIGGGVENTLSLLKLVDILKSKLDCPIDPEFSAERPGDQKVFICNTDKFKEAAGWSTMTSVDEGLDILITWVNENKDLVSKVLK